MGLTSRLRIAFDRGGEMGARMSALDWSATTVGDPSAWPEELTGAIVTMLASRAPIVVCWGPEHTAFYNDASRSVTGGEPGRPVAETWDVRALLDGVIANDASFASEDHPFTLDPIRDAEGRPAGVFCIITDKTAASGDLWEIVGRLRGLVDVASSLNAVPTTAEVLDVAARHVLALTSAGRVVVTAPEARAEQDGGATVPPSEPDVVLPLPSDSSPDDAGPPLGELRVWDGADGPAEPALLNQLARLIGLRLANARLYETEHRIASTLQHSLLPQSLPRVPGAIVASRYVPGSSEARVGGDWYDAIAAPDGELFLVIGDVVGKGVQAAAGMGQLRNALRAYVLEGFDCGAALTRLNRLVDTLGRRQFATVICVAFDPRTRRLRFSSAGHPSPIVVEGGKAGEFLYATAMGPPIGALGNVTYPTRERELSSGGRLLLYTDGLVEDRRQGIDTGLAELTADVARPTDHVEDLLDALLVKAARHARRDDIALLALEVTEPREFVLRLPADPSRLTVMRRRLEDFLTAHAVPDNDAFDLVVAVSEAAANAIEHPLDPDEPVIVVEASHTGDAVVVTIHDTGRWRPATDAGFRGRGLALIGALTELSVHRSPQGTAVTLRRPLNPA
ncbi:anti-sigma regulatory factor (Ser/Thr protein kinase) [Actinoplanes lutulentus]|uniref:Serine phosphatase RsbU (Regulator of sigma subunit) n=2 Tax=Actinoplanes lutulentus TaxID=1287878 RepID=A0A327ZF71_9ACTN|nr:SpoIIE family protein phosphatase [Actinoplanes lutulentus]MBB2942264.1 anti-sigma regulatory factor (Ser/Thr protein kinase) [Actinoplanes lutulentus]RAK33033.1 serine phosphatase RsbU (regulator of sigma subunit) [Actinoplanes lutulentus]